MAGKGEKAEALLDALTTNPFSLRRIGLRGEVEGLSSIKITAVDRLVIEIEKYADENNEGIVNVIRMITHSEGTLPIFFL